MTSVYMRQVYFKAVWWQQKGGMYLVLFFAIKISWRKHIRLEREVQEKMVEQEDIASCGSTDDLFYFGVCVQSGGCNLIHWGWGSATKSLSNYLHLVLCGNTLVSPHGGEFTLSDAVVSYLKEGD